MAYKQNTSIKGVYKKCFIEEGRLIDGETGEAIDLIKDFTERFEDNEFSITAAYKEDVELD